MSVAIIGSKSGTLAATFPFSLIASIKRSILGAPDVFDHFGRESKFTYRCSLLMISDAFDICLPLLMISRLAYSKSLSTQSRP